MATITGTPGNDSLRGTAQNDVLLGMGGHDTLFGLAGNDLFRAAPNPIQNTGNSAYYGGEGDDTFQADAGNDSYQGGNGIDTILFLSSTFSVRVELSITGPQRTGWGADTFINIENIYSYAEGDSYYQGNDVANRIDARGYGADTLSGLDGDDTLLGNFGNDVLWGGRGNDEIYAEEGGNRIYGQSGNDHIILRYSNGGNLLDLGPGENDKITFTGLNSGFSINNGVTNLGDTILGAEMIEFEVTDDLYITGHNGNDRFQVDQISDDATVTINLGNGNNYLDATWIFGNVTAGAGNDTIHRFWGSGNTSTGAGNDFIEISSTEDGISNIDAGSGNDTIDAYEMEGRVLAGAGNDSLTLTNVTGSIYGGDGNDVIDVLYDAKELSGTREVSGGAGDDQIIVLEEFSNAFQGLLLSGGTGNDTLEVASSFGGRIQGPTIDGGAGNDLLIGSRYSETLDGGADVDTMRGGNGDDRYILTAGDVVTELAGGGVDTVVIMSNYVMHSYVENLQTGGTGAFTSTGNAMNNIMSGNGAGNRMDGAFGNDQIWGGGGDDSLLGGVGNDRLDGGVGRDTLIGGAGADTLVGGANVDIADYSAATSGLTINMAVRGASTGDAAGDLLVGVEGVNGSRYADRIIGDNLDNDLFGWMGADQLDGGGGNDTLRAGLGDDQLTGGAGNDLLVGGAGYDHFIFRPGAGLDIISDFQNGADKLVVTGLVSGFASVNVSQTTEGALLRFVGSVVSVLISGQPVSGIDASDFIFI